MTICLFWLISAFKGVAKFLFEIEAVLQELDIVDEENVEGAVKSFHPVDRFVSQMIDDVVDERFGCDALDLAASYDARGHSGRCAWRRWVFPRPTPPWMKRGL